MAMTGAPRVSTPVRQAYRKSWPPNARHVQVQDDQVGRPLPDPPEGVDAVPGALDREPLVLQGDPERLAEVDVVLDHEDRPALGCGRGVHGPVVAWR